MGKATIRDVAGLAGVSPSSVSRSLRGVGGVSTATTERIRGAADRLGYTVSPAAYRLATGRTGTVAVVMPYLTRWFFGQLLGGAEAVVREAGLDLLLYHVGDTEMRQRYFSWGILRKRVDGVLLATLALTEPEVHALRSLDVPVCMVGTEVDGFSSVCIDDVSSARTAVQHLINLGHERVAIIAGDPHEPIHFTVPPQRRAGYLAALEAAGLPTGPELEAQGTFTVEGGEKATVALLGRETLPTAIFAECDEMAFGALQVLGKVGLRVPEDVSVVGFDDHPMASYFGLTTIAQDVAQQGREIAAHLVRSVQADGTKPARLRAPTQLIVRSTTSAPARRKPHGIPAVRPAAVTGAEGGSTHRSSRCAPANGHDPLTAPPIARQGGHKRLVTIKNNKKGEAQL